MNSRYIFSKRGLKCVMSIWLCIVYNFFCFVRKDVKHKTDEIVWGYRAPTDTPCRGMQKALLHIFDPAVVESKMEDQTVCAIYHESTSNCSKRSYYIMGYGYVHTQAMSHVSTLKCLVEHKHNKDDWWNHRHCKVFTFTTIT